MINKKLITGISCSVFALILALSLFLIKNNNKNTTTVNPKTAETAVKKPSETSKTETREEINEIKDKSELAYYTKYDIPFISISDISKLPAAAKTAVEQILEENANVYLVKYNPDNEEVFIIFKKSYSESDKYERHSLGFIKVFKNGEVEYFNNIYDGKEGETSNSVSQEDDVWEFDNTSEPARPLKHTAFNDKGKVEFTEEWNYSGDNPVKYERKNAKEKPISILKESQSGDSDYRVEHIFYDKDGKTQTSLSVMYDCANVKHFSYYDSQNPKDTIVIESEFENGNKIGEKIYNKDFEQVNDFRAIYSNGEITEIEEIEVQASNDIGETSE